MVKKVSLMVSLFREEGFIRKICSSCGRSFWTLDEKRKTCGDQPCDDYNFIGNPVGKDFTTLRELREAFLKFFERQGHTRIKRYPVVARWRDDVYLVGASIYDFQPWVTEGIVPPPANPLVISQPCIRLTDIDNVGKTGRHLTNFEMMAHHAFNIKERVYWMDETVEYAFRFLTEEMKVPPEEITFKEDWWSGGGNAGEDFEVLVRGLEVATLVFMHYKVVNGKAIPMDNEIVDTGYGLERLYWLVKGSPTVYDVLFGDLVDKLRSIIGLEPRDTRIFEAISKYMGKLDAKKPESLKRVKAMVSSELGMSVEELDSIVRPYEAIYTVLDHTRALMFMIGDGVVPSNTGSGYLARLLIRRSIRNLMRLRADLTLEEILYAQIDKWGREFPEYLEIKDTILDVIRHEEEKYRGTLRSGHRVIMRELQKLKKRNIKEFPLDSLIVLYDSHGLPPEYVKEIAEAEGIMVSVPVDFYSKLAELHEARGRGFEFKEELERELYEKIKELPPTRQLYYENPYQFEFKAKVIKAIGNYVVLDKTAFYPEGGGQPSDQGYLIRDNDKYRVRDVKKLGNIVVHICETCGLREGEEVLGIIDRERRLSLMRSHTATHILLSAARKVLGKHVWQAGAQKGVTRSRLDITHYKRISDGELDKIEELANRVVLENRRVKAQFMPRNEAEMKYGFILYQGGVVPGPEIRVVEVEGWDVEACGGLHVSRTGEVGLIKVLRVDRIQDGVERIEFSTGIAAFNYIKSLERLVKEVCTTMNTDIETLRSKVEKVVKENEELRKKINRLVRERESIEVDLLLKSSINIDGIVLVTKIYENTDIDSLMRIGIETVKREPSAVVTLFSKKTKNFVLFLGREAQRRLNAERIGRALISKFGGRGGGSKRMYSGVTERTGTINELVKAMIDIIQKSV